ncbi:hypothetical protein LILAB_21880 [Corallococcus macrosporus]|uniref:Lipoprotein n=1 Tax=Myxococcus fulvus (strain ATCC BAA-855 / HW-1) TaxID=483219 RepID=F8CHF8_MYXFH|nr:hypothetical protein LILAB_21880 [Corallococcus macrosporus]
MLLLSVLQRFPRVPASSPVFLLALALLAGPALAAPCSTVRHIEIPAVPAGDAQPVCISPGQTTVVSFDAQLAPGSVTLEGTDGFTMVDPGASTLKLVPSEKVPLDKPLRLTVRFADNAAPLSASIVLVAHAEEAASLVEVHRRQRSAESYKQELKAKEEEARQLREEVARLRADKSGPGGLRGLLASGAMGKDGVASKEISPTLTAPPTKSLWVVGVTAYRSASRVALEVELSNPEAAPTWTGEGATLTLEGKKGVTLKVLPVWQHAPIAPGENRFVVVEAEATVEEARGNFTLKMWEEGGTRTVTIGGVTFP